MNFYIYAPLITCLVCIHTTYSLSEGGAASQCNCFWWSAGSLGYDAENLCGKEKRCYQGRTDGINFLLPDAARRILHANAYIDRVEKGRYPIGG